MKKILLSFALAVGLLASASTLQAQVNMSRYITLTVTNWSAIKLTFKAAANGTPVRIVSGSNTQDITVGTGWYDGNTPSTFTVTADGTEMKVYGDIISFNCSINGANITELDLSHNTQLTSLNCGFNKLTTLDVSQNTQLTSLNCWSDQLTTLDVSQNTQLTELNCGYNQLTTLNVTKNTQLTELYCSSNQFTSLNVTKNTKLKKLICYGNNFSTLDLDRIYCTLPDRKDSTDAGEIYPVYSDTSSNHAIVLATNKANAIAKNWTVQYAKDNADIPATSGTYDCSTAVAEATAEPSLTLYPNPVADVLYLSSTARTIRVYNIDGIEVAYATDTDRVEVSHLPAGIYTVRADGTVATMVKSANASIKN